jgi:selenocysteine lyase/cysteine desulfurase
VIDTDLMTPLIFQGAHRSGLLAIDFRRHEAEALAPRLLERGFVCTARCGYLRVAPHFYIGDDDIARFAETLNELAA